MGNKDLQTFQDSAQPPVVGPLAFDAAEYMEYMEDAPMTEAQKIEFLQALWAIMAAFVNYGWGVDSVIPLLAKKASESEKAALEEVYPTPNFNVAADDEAGEGTE